jgi:predicted small lipoprotein YifL
MSHTRTYALAIAAIFALPLAACSGSGGEETPPDAVTEDAAVVDNTDTNSAPATDTDAAPDTNSDTSSIDTEDPCVLTGAEINSVMGGSFDDGQLNTEFSSKPDFYCEYTNADTGVVGLVVVLTVPPRGFSIEDRRGTYETVTDNIADVTVAGADSAYSVDEWTVLAQKGGYSFTIQNLQRTEGDPDGDTVALTELAVANLG